MSAFDIAADCTVGHEGDTLDLDPNDRGNWSGGKVGAGTLRGSKYGIAAAFHPDVDIAALTWDAARAIYRHEYWDPLHGDALPPRLAVMVFDSAINNGVGAATRLLQASVGVAADGVAGDVTLRAVAAWVAARGSDSLCQEFLARRIVLESSVPVWQRDALGLARRLAAQPYDALRVPS